MRFGAAAAASFTVNSATKITATSPAGSGVVDITVTTAVGTSVTSIADHFTYTTSPPPGDQPISATGGFTFGGKAPASISGTVATFTDPDLTATASEYSASVDWGDGLSRRPIRSPAAQAASRSPRATPTAPRARSRSR